VVVRNDVIVDGTLNLPSQMPFHASLLYANNITNLALHMSSEGRVEPDFDDEIVAGCCITHDGRVVNDRVREVLDGERAADPQADRPVGERTTSP
jgi:NAD(P) transhydrogenase subunit alpha